MRTHLTLMLLVLGALSSACGTTPPACSASTCDGCCAADGQCVRLGTESACGRGGVACKACGAAEMCSFGSCMPTSFSTGGGTVVGGGNAAGGSVGGGSAGGRVGGGSAGGGSAGGSTFCGPSTCAGCCRSDGSCNLAPSTQSCGSQGQLCRDCQALGQTCSQQTFSCTGTGGGTAGGSVLGGGTAGGSVLGGGAAGGSVLGGGAAAGGSANDNRLRLFVTSTTFTANLGGSVGADQRCQTAATAGNKGGTWLAFLGNPTTSPLMPLVGLGPWYQERSDGTFLLTYNNTANLQTGALANLTTDEQGRAFSSTTYFWSGMNADASNASLGTCSGWTSTASTTTAGALSTLSVSGSVYCSDSYHLLCLERSRMPRPPPPSPTRKRVFVTSTTFTANLGGLSGADARCQTAATAANKGGTWIAFLAGPSTPAISRVTGQGPWYQERTGGTFVLTYNNAANLQTGALANLTTDEQGRTFSSTTYFWSGMNADASNAGLGTCSGWSSTSSTTTAGALSTLSVSGSVYCSDSYHLLCLEQ